MPTLSISNLGLVLSIDLAHEPKQVANNCSSYTHQYNTSLHLSSSHMKDDFIFSSIFPAPDIPCNLGS